MLHHQIDFKGICKENLDRIMFIKEYFGIYDKIGTKQWDISREIVNSRYQDESTKAPRGMRSKKSAGPSDK